LIFVFYFFALALIVLSYKSFRGGVNYLNFFKADLARPPSRFTPFASVIAPCKGIDNELHENLSALLCQDYPDYEVIFVADDETDAAVPVVRDVMANNSQPSKLVIAPKTTTSSQKVENLREAVLHIADGSGVLVFVDSDARPGRNWLRDLIAPLEDEDIGAATGYRWFIPRNPSFASEMLSVWNASIASSLGPNVKSNFCWGGSTAIQREVFERLEIRERWRGALSDDFTVTRVIKEARMTIFFVPRALIASIENCGLKGLLEFTTRQMKITRVYSPDLWIAAFIGSGIFNLVFAWGIAIIIYRLINGGPIWPAAAALVLVAAFSTGKSWLRSNAVKLVLPDRKAELKRQSWPQNTLWILSPALFFLNAAAAALSRKITWRGITYELKSPSETVILERSETDDQTI
jgi:cellulose synthase/poly-beta-1,6-N-acetylglucosamine synthase-like glycosyltransferase